MINGDMFKRDKKAERGQDCVQKWDNSAECFKQRSGKSHGANIQDNWEVGFSYEHKVQVGLTH